MSDEIIFKIGCDPEVFFTKRKEFRSAAGVIPGDKHSPHKVSNGAIQVDGLAAEFNTDPCVLYVPNIIYKKFDFSEFNERVLGVLSNIHQRANEAGYNISQASFAEFDREYYDSLPEDTKELGCDPDFNAYTGEMNEIDRNPELETCRGAAGHIHIGWGNDIPVDHPDHLTICRDAVRALDRWVGLSLIAYGDTDIRRRRCYGKAGAFRPKSYGVEYRSPSNWWIWNQKRRKIVFNYAQKCMKDLSGARQFERVSDEDVQQVMNDELVDSETRKFVAMANLNRMGVYL